MPINPLEARSPPAMSTPSLPPISPLRALLEVTRLLRAEEELPELLAAIARTIAESLGYGTVAINLYRPAWDDFCVTTVHGSQAAQDALLGRVRDLADWERLLDDRFLRRGAYVIEHGAVDWDAVGVTYVPDMRAADLRRAVASGGRAVRPDAPLGRASARHPLGRRAEERAARRRRGARRPVGAVGARRVRGAGGPGGGRRGAAPPRARGAARRLVASDRRARRRRDPARRVQRHPRRARLPQRLRSARRPVDGAARAAGVGRMGDGGSPRRRRRPRSRTSSRCSIRRSRSRAATCSRTRRRGAASRPRSGATSRI